MKKNIPILIVSAILVLSLLGNLLQFINTAGNDWVVLHFPDANSRDTYFSIHNIQEAHVYGTGTGVKVGILDWGFGFEKHDGIYAGGKDFTGNRDNFNNTSEHGYQMALVLKETAPDCQVYALGTYVPNNEEQWVDNMVEAISWAMEHDINILTLSHQPLSDENRERFDRAVNEAVASGIATTFIHYDNPNNILPDGMFASTWENRQPDINIYHYDYNTVFVTQLLQNEEIPFLSLSSTSPVTAGFLAILMEIDGSLTPEQYRQVLIDTSYETHFPDPNYPEQQGNVERVADIQSAAEYLTYNKNSIVH